MQAPWQLGFQRTMELTGRVYQELVAMLEPLLVLSLGNEGMTYINF